MKKLIMFIICLLVFPVCLLFTGCSKNSDFNNDFQKVYCGDEMVIVHKKTRVMYLFQKAGYGGGLTVMLNPDGTPMIYEGELDG